MFGLGAGEITIILVVVLLFFGGKKLPQLGSAMGKAITNFKKGLKEGSESEDQEPKGSENGTISEKKDDEPKNPA